MNHSVKEIEKLEPFFSTWMEKLTSDNLHEKGDIAFELARLNKALADWVYCEETPKDYMRCRDNAKIAIGAKIK